MRDRFIRLAPLILVILLGALVVQPYIDRALFSATTPRAIDARGDLADIERSTVKMFEQVSPFVVQVAGRRGGSDLRMP